jgi:hypothetical protein
MDFRPKMAVTGQDESVIGCGGEKLGPHYNPVLAWANKVEIDPQASPYPINILSWL